MIDGFAQILGAAQAGDEQAVTVLWRDLQPRVLRYLAARQPDCAEDVASETWLRAARDLPHFRGVEAEFRAWMFTIARHALVDWQRKVSRRPITATLVEDAADQESRDPADLAVEHLATDAALGLIGQLPASQAEVILLRVIGGLDTRRVGALVGKRAGTVRMLQHRGLARLAELIGVESPVAEGVTS